MKCHSHEHGRAELPELTDKLRRKSRKITGPRQAILQILRQHPHPMSNKEIFAELKGDCDLATVYRSLHLLESMHMVKRFDLGDGIARFELLAEGDDGHHHHLVCSRCAAVVEIDDCFTRELEERIAAKSGFKAITHRLEFFGICPQCQ
ncbi:Fur family transcriptional regulator [Pedosphaera parvula]|uniref:Ferric uptake regulator, Fur family n=1 Tax=Pedosphaera parvula (strain Ellin514) TaxID=320771 RepID=B9XR73_PEDPL|nr:Fur family transcriptional regulator [Pedosphaera parvula]EEF57686.1 ferric uptake regulator, Fur family [Pedosphaera parvula Ellin514]